MKLTRPLISLLRFAHEKILWLHLVTLTLLLQPVTATFDFNSPQVKQIFATADSLVQEVQTSPLRLLPPLEDRDAWHSLENNYNLQALIIEARRMAQIDLREINDPYEQTKRLRVFCLAEAFTNNGEFKEHLQSEIEAMLRETTWVLPAHDYRKDARYNRSASIDLMAIERAWNLAITAGVFANSLDPDTMDIIRRTLRHRIIDPFVLRILQGQPYPDEFWWLTSTNNWNSVLHAGILGTGLQILESKHERALLIACIQQNNYRYTDGYQDDGYCSEGLGYWNYGFQAYTRMAVILREHTHSTIDLLANDKVHAISRYPQKLALVMNVYPAYSDADIGLAPFLYNADTSPSLGFSLIDPGILRIMTASAEMAPLLPTSLRDAFPGSGIYTMRDFTPHELPMALSIKTGHNGEHHNHNDVGSFTFTLGHMSLILDPGREVYSERTFSPSRYESDIINSFGHPVPLVDGQRQKTGKEFHGKLLHQSLSDEQDVLTFSLREAYSVPHLKTLVRKIIFNRGPNRYVQITDEVAYEKPSQFETALITYADVEISDTHTFTIQSGSHAIRAEVIANGTDVEITTSPLNVTTPTGRQPTRISLRAVQPVLNASIEVRWQPVQPTSGYPATLSLSDSKEIPSIRIQAESFTKQEGGHALTLEKMASENLSISHWNEPQHSITWSFNIPESGEYTMRVRYCHPLPANIFRSVQIDDSLSSVPFFFPGASGWSHYADNWETVTWTEHEQPVWLFLSEGTHELTMTADGYGLALDWIEWLPRNTSSE